MTVSGLLVLRPVRSGPCRAGLVLACLLALLVPELSGQAAGAVPLSRSPAPAASDPAGSASVGPSARASESSVVPSVLADSLATDRTSRAVALQDMEAAWLSPKASEISTGLDIRQVLAPLAWQSAESFAAPLPGCRVLRTVLDTGSGSGKLLALRPAWPKNTRVYVQDIQSPQVPVLLEQFDPSAPVWQLPQAGTHGLQLWIITGYLPGQDIPTLEILSSGIIHPGIPGWLMLGCGIVLVIFLGLLSLVLQKRVLVLWTAGLVWICFFTWLRLGGAGNLEVLLPLWFRNQADLLFLAPLASFCLLSLAQVLGGFRNAQSRFWTVSALANLAFLVVICLGGQDIPGAFLSFVLKAGIGLEFLALAVLGLKGSQESGRELPWLQGSIRFCGAGGLALMVLHVLDPASSAWMLGLLCLPGPSLWLLVLGPGALILLAGILGQLKAAQVHEKELLVQKENMDGVLKAALQGIEAQKEEIRRLSEEDDETGLTRKEPFLAHVEREHIRYVRYSSPFSLMLVELDHLKQFRIDYSEPTVQAGRLWFFRAIKAAVRSADVVGRFGDGSVIFLMPGTTALQAMLAAEKFRNLVRESSRDAPDCPSILQGKLTVSIGVAAPRKSGQDLHRLIQELEDALTKARLAGGNRAALSPLALKDDEQDSSRNTW